MDAKHRSAQLLGVVAILIGCLIGLFLLRLLVLGHIADVWMALVDVFVAALAAYLISVGFRAIRYSTAIEQDKSPRFKWGRVLSGSWLIFIEMNSQFHPAPNLLKANNLGESVGMMTMLVVLVLIGSWLVISGLRARFVPRHLTAH